MFFAIAPLVAVVTSCLMLAGPTTGDIPPSRRIVLWNSGTCPYAQRAWIALKEKGVPFEHKIIDLSHKPDEFLAKYAAAVGGDTTVRAKVPLLECGDDTLVVESEDVIKFIGAAIEPDDSMYPVDYIELRARIDRFLPAFEDVIQGYYKYLTASSKDEEEMGKLAFCKALKNLETEIEGPFCLGESFSVAECYAAPWVHRFDVVVPYFRGAQLQDLIVTDSKVAQWMQAVLQRPSVQSTNVPSSSLLQSTRNHFVKYVTPGTLAEKEA